jgi:hypothetical protein
MTPSTKPARFSRFFTLLYLLPSMSLASCRSAPLNVTAVPNDSSLGVAETLAASTTLLPSPGSYTAPFPIWVNPDLPTAISDSITGNPTLTISATEAGAEGFLSTAGGQLVGYWTYLAVVPFHSLLRTISSTELREIWENGPSEQSGISSLFITPETHDVFRLIWGEPGENAVNVIAAEDFREAAWPVLNSLAIIPFSEIDPTWIVLEVDGVFPLGPDFSSDNYALNVPLYLSSQEVPLNIIGDGLQLQNFDRSKLTSVALTGVTALVRDILLRSCAAQISHTSATKCLLPRIAPRLTRINLLYISAPAIAILPFWLMSAQILSNLAVIILAIGALKPCSIPLTCITLRVG